MEVDSQPSSSSGPSPRPLSDCSSSSESDLSNVASGFRSAVPGMNRLKQNAKLTLSSSVYSNSEVLYQNCVRPSLVKAMFGKAEMNDVRSSTHIRIPRKAKKKSIRMNISEDEDEESTDSAKPDSSLVDNHSNNASEKLTRQSAWTGKSRPCHCPSCCLCRHHSSINNKVTANFASWPRNRTCPLQMSLRTHRQVDIPMAVKFSPDTVSREHAMQTQLANFSPSGDITVSHLTLHPEEETKKYRDVSQAAAMRNFCCPRRIEYGRKSLSLPTDVSLDSYDQLGHHQLDGTSYSAIPNSAEKKQELKSALPPKNFDNQCRVPSSQTCQNSVVGCANNHHAFIENHHTCNHIQSAGHDSSSSQGVWNQGVDGSVFKQRIEV